MIMWLINYDLIEDGEPCCCEQDSHERCNCELKKKCVEAFWYDTAWDEDEEEFVCVGCEKRCSLSSDCREGENVICGKAKNRS
jgi:hypothetical protein